MKRILILLYLFTFTATLHAEETTFEFSDLEGKPHTPLAVGEEEAVVLVFISPSCAISNALIPEINRIAVDYAGRVSFYLVETDLGIKVADAEKHAKTMEIKVPVLLDPKLRLARLTRTEITPEAVVF